MEISLINSMRIQFFELGSSSILNVLKDFSLVNTRGKLTAGIVNIAFGCELSLKQLIFSSSSKIQYGHNLEKLFQSRRAELQISIKAKYEKFRLKRNFMPPPSSYLGEIPKYNHFDLRDFDKCLMGAKKYFEDYRYYFEEKKFEAESISNNKTLFFIFDYRFLWYFYEALNEILNRLNSGEDI